jgi:hypothetical protein
MNYLQEVAAHLNAAQEAAKHLDQDTHSTLIEAIDDICMLVADCQETEITDTRDGSIFDSAAESALESADAGLRNELQANR